MAARPTIGEKPVVLLVDDDGAVLNAVSFALATDGLEVAAFEHAEAAIAARPSALSCLVVDHQLPGRSGLQLVDDLRAEGVSAPAILMTSNPSLTLRRRARERGVEIVEKPLLGDVLARAVRRLIGA